jgi:hypothetical protein
MSLPGDDSARFVLHFGLTGIEDPADSKDFKAFYFDQVLHIKFLSSNDIVTVFDLHGIQMKQIHSQGMESLAYPIALPPGVYLLRLVSGNITRSMKIMVH